MKKIFLLFLIVFLTVGCSSQSTDSSSNSNNNSAETNNNKSAETNNNEKAQASLSETIILDEKEVVVTAKEIKESIFGTDLTVSIENNSEKNLTFQIRDSSINGYMIDALFSCDVAAGKKANDSITFSNTQMELCNIKDISDIEFSFYIFDDNWDDYLVSDLVTLKTSISDSYKYEFDDSGLELYNDGSIRIIYKGLDTESILGSDVLLYIENMSDRNICVQARNASINGYMINPLLSEEVVPGKRAIADMTIMSSDLESNNIEKIEEIELSFHIFDNDSWDTIVDTESISFNAE